MLAWNTFLSYQRRSGSILIMYAKITFTAKLDLNSPLWPIGMTDEEKLQGWLFAARMEPKVAMEALDFEIDGELVEE